MCCVTRTPSAAWFCCCMDAKTLSPHLSLPVLRSLLRLLSCSNLNASGLKNLKASVPPPLLSSFWKVPWRPCVELAEPLMEVARVSESCVEETLCQSCTREKNHPCSDASEISGLICYSAELLFLDEYNYLIIMCLQDAGF